MAHVRHKTGVGKNTEGLLGNISLFLQAPVSLSAMCKYSSHYNLYCNSISKSQCLSLKKQIDIVKHRLYYAGLTTAIELLLCIVYLMFMVKTNYCTMQICTETFQLILFLHDEFCLIFLLLMQYIPSNIDPVIIYFEVHKFVLNQKWR